jgi:hypothetical protein
MGGVALDAELLSRLYRPSAEPFRRELGGVPHERPREPDPDDRRTRRETRDALEEVSGQSTTDSKP